MPTINLPPDFNEFLRLLHKQGVEYLLIGGYAVSYHGYPRATLDIDIWVDDKSENAWRVVTALKEFGFDVPDLSVELFMPKDQFIRLGVPPFRIKIATGISGVEFRPCFERRIIDTLDGVSVNIISLDDLKANKIAAARHKDLDDAGYLP